MAELFDARASNYDEDNLRARLASRLVDIARPQPGERVLDIATGTGLVAIPTARLIGESGRVVGVDLSKGMLGRASKAVEAEGLGNIELIHIDAEKPAFPASKPRNETKKETVLQVSGWKETRKGADIVRPRWPLRRIHDLIQR